MTNVSMSRRHPDIDRQGAHNYMFLLCKQSSTSLLINAEPRIKSLNKRKCDKH